MDHERYPTYFLAVSLLYAVIFLVALSYFVLPSLSFGFAYSDFYILFALIFLPLLLLIVYSQTSRVEFLQGKESILRTAITILTIIDFVIILYFMILLI